MNGDIKIDVSSIFPFAIDKVLGMFGKDAITIAAKDQLEKNIRIALQEASFVQCVGMDKPIPIQDIYQTTRLKQKLFSENEMINDFWQLLNLDESSIILAGPGCGKTVLMHWIYINLLKEKNIIPILFILRWPSSLESLENFITNISSNKIFKKKKNDKIVLLVDGYDEINLKQRKKVSELLRDFSTLKVGNFYLTCRTFYEIIDLKAPQFYIESFSREDSLAFVNCFFKVYDQIYNAEELVDELEERGFSDFLSSPLMLTLVCILKTGPLPNLPKNSIGLIRRSLDTLTFRWDEKKGISRSGQVPLDGEERIRCLMRIAYDFKSPIGPEGKLFLSLNEHLTYLQRSDIDIAKLLREMAQWYGIFIPVSDGQWAFAHRTIHDFLAARYWVESGLFSKGLISRWDTRTAYAACLVPDATSYIKRSLNRSKELHVLTECLANNAPFDTKEVAKEIIKHFKHWPDFTYKKNIQTIEIQFFNDFFYLGSDKFLHSLALAGTFGREKIHDAIFIFSISELSLRGKKLSYKLRSDLLNLKLIAQRSFNTHKINLKDLYKDS